MPASIIDRRRFALALLPSWIGMNSIALAQSQAPRSPIAPRILAVAREAKGKTIGRGECWDLAQHALTQANAQWDGQKQYGRPLGRQDTIQPGDIMQFTSLRLEWRNAGGSGWTQLGFPDHTAIVLSAKGTVIELAHQNYNRVRKVIFTTIDLSQRVSGTYAVYRPQPKA